MKVFLKIPWPRVSVYIELSRHTNPVPALESYRGGKEKGREVEKKEVLAGEVKRA